MAHLKFQNPEKLRQGQNQGHIQIKGDLGVGETAFPEPVMVEKVIEASPVLDGIDNSPLPMHLLQGLRDVGIELDSLKKPIEKPV
jgi:hypothetical protein